MALTDVNGNGMSYRLKSGEPIGEGVRRVAREQAEQALASAAAGDQPAATRVHDVRKCSKKLRGLLRLVRPHLGDRYRIEKDAIRIAARRLSGSRDAAVLLAAFDGLVKKRPGERADFDALRSALIESSGEVRRADHSEEQLAAFADELRDLLERIDEWRVDVNGFNAVGDGVLRSYRDGRTAMRKALKSSDVLDWHEWRKRVKDHWYHVRLLRDVWKPVMKARQGELERLSELLGEDHDLAVLHETITGSAAAAPEAAVALLAEIDRKRDKRQAAARPIGQRVYAEKPTALGQRLRHYWKVWLHECEPAGV